MFKIGDHVQWVKKRQQGRSIIFSQREGAILEMLGESAIVRDFKSRQRIVIKLKLLRSNSEKGQLTEAILG